MGVETGRGVTSYDNQYQKLCFEGYGAVAELAHLLEFLEECPERIFGWHVWREFLAGAQAELFSDIEKAVLWFACWDKFKTGCGDVVKIRHDHHDMRMMERMTKDRNLKRYIAGI